MKIPIICQILWLTSCILPGVFSDFLNYDIFKPKAIGRKRSHNVAFWPKNNGDNMAAFKMEALKSILADKKKGALDKTTTRVPNKESTTVCDSSETLSSTSDSNRTQDDNYLKSICDQAISSSEASSDRKKQDTTCTTVGKPGKQQSLAAEDFETVYTTSARSTRKKPATTTKTVSTTSTSSYETSCVCSTEDSTEESTYTCKNELSTNKSSTTKSLPTTNKKDQTKSTTKQKQSTTTTKTKKKIMKDIGESGTSLKSSGWKKLSNFFKNSESRTQTILKDDRPSTLPDQSDNEELDSSTKQNEPVTESVSNDFFQENGLYNTAESTMQSGSYNYDLGDYITSQSKIMNEYPEKHGHQKKQKGSSSHNKHKKEKSDVFAQREKNIASGDNDSRVKNNDNEMTITQKDRQINHKINDENDRFHDYNKLQEKNIESEQIYNSAVQKERDLQKSNKNHNIDFSGNESLVYSYDEQRDEGFTGKEKYIYINDGVTQRVQGFKPQIHLGYPSNEFLNLDKSFESESSTISIHRVNSGLSQYNIREKNENYPSMGMMKKELYSPSMISLKNKETENQFKAKEAIENKHQVINKYTEIKNIPKDQYKSVEGKEYFGKDYDRSGSITENQLYQKQDPNIYTDSPENHEQYTESNNNKANENFKENALNNRQEVVKNPEDINNKNELDSSSVEHNTQDSNPLEESDYGLKKIGRNKSFWRNRMHFINFKNQHNENQASKSSIDSQNPMENIKSNDTQEREVISGEGLLNKQEPKERQENERYNAMPADEKSSDQIAGEPVAKQSMASDLYSTQPIAMFMNSLPHIGSFDRSHGLLKSITHALGLEKSDENKKYDLSTVPCQNSRHSTTLESFEKTNFNKFHNRYSFQDNTNGIATLHFLPLVRASSTNRDVNEYSTKKLITLPTNENNLNKYNLQVMTTERNSPVLFATESSTNGLFDVTTEGSNDQEILEISDSLSAFTTKPAPFKKVENKWNISAETSNGDLNFRKKNLDELRRPSLGLQKFTMFRTSNAPNFEKEQKDSSEVQNDNISQAYPLVDFNADKFSNNNDSMNVNFSLSGMETYTKGGSFDGNTVLSNNKMDSNEMYLRQMNKDSNTLPSANNEFTIPDNFDMYKSMTGEEQNKASNNNGFTFQHFSESADVGKLSTPLWEGQKKNFLFFTTNKTVSSIDENETQRNGLYNTAYTISKNMKVEIPPSVNKDDPEWKNWIPLKIMNVSSTPSQVGSNMEMNDPLVNAKLNLSKNAEQNMDYMNLGNENNAVTQNTFENNQSNHEKKSSDDLLHHNNYKELFSTIKMDLSTENINADLRSGPFQNPFPVTAIEQLQKLFHHLPNIMSMDKHRLPINNFFNFPNIYSQVTGMGKIPNGNFIDHNTNSIFMNMFPNILISDLLSDSPMNQTWELIPLDDYLDSELPDNGKMDLFQNRLNQSSVDFMPVSRGKPKDNRFSVEMSVMKVVHGLPIGRPKYLSNNFLAPNQSLDHIFPTEVVFNAATNYESANNIETNQNMNSDKEALNPINELSTGTSLNLLQAVEGITMKQQNLSENGIKDSGLQMSKNQNAVKPILPETKMISPVLVVSTKHEGLLKDSATQVLEDSEIHKLRPANFSWRNEMQSILNNNYVSQADGELSNSSSGSSNQLSYILNQNLGHLDLDRSALYKYLTKERVNFIDKQSCPIDNDKRNIKKRSAERKFDKKHKSKELEYILQRNLPSLPLNKKHFINYMMNNLESTTESLDYERVPTYSKSRMQSEIERNIRKPQQKLNLEQKLKRPWGRNPQMKTDIAQKYP